MAPTHSIAFCNNRGGVGKTFMAFQTACETARSRPDKKVLVLDFSLYSDITALLLGGSAREGFGAPMKGLQVTVENTTEDTRAEGLIRDLEHAMDTDEHAAAAEKKGGSIFGAFFAKKKDASTATVDLTELPHPTRRSQRRHPIQPLPHPFRRVRLVDGYPVRRDRAFAAVDQER